MVNDVKLALRICAYLLRKEPAGFAEAFWWFVVGKRLRARNRLHSLLNNSRWTYPLWIRLYERSSGTSAEERQGICSSDPLVTVWLYLAFEAIPAAVKATMSSLENQRGVAFEVIISGPAAMLHDYADKIKGTIYLEAASQTEALASVLARARGRYLVPLRPGLELGYDVINTYAAIAYAEAALPILYGDQDEKDEKGRRCKPWFKPQWDPDLFLAQDYITSACAIPVVAARKAEWSRNDATMDLVVTYRLVLHLTRNCGMAVRHIPRIVMHCPPGTWCDDTEQTARVALLADDLRRDGAEVEIGQFGTVAVHWPMPSPVPGVTVIVPTRDRLDLLHPCIKGVLDKTDYPRVDVTIVDNGSTQTDMLAYLRALANDSRVTIVRWDKPYNYSELNNVAVERTDNPYLCLLNNDIEVIDPLWLDTLMRYAVRPDAGAVGARLLYPDGTIQHAGVVIGMGGAAGHAHRALSQGDPGYFGQAYVAREATAVTAACLVVARDKYLAVGGLDADHLRVAYNDVDLCLKLRASGLRNYYVPQACLIHHEGKSRGSDFSSEQRARYYDELNTLQRRWDTRDYRDPTHHEALDRSSETYRMAYRQRW